MVSTFTSGKMHLEKPAAGDYVDAWAPPINANFDNADSAVSTSTAVVITSADVTLTQAQARNLHINCSGALSATRNLIWPNVGSGLAGGVWIVTNGCTGAFTLSLFVNGGTGILIPQGKRMLVFSDGVNMYGGDDWIANAIAAVTVNPNGVLAGLAGNTARPLTDLVWDNVAGLLYFATGGTAWKRVAPNFPLATVEIGDLQVTNPKLAGPRRTTTYLLNGSGLTYTVPANCKTLIIRMIGAGGGGGPASGSPGGNGTATTFNSISANPGGGGNQFPSTVGAGGIGGAGAANFRMQGNAGHPGGENIPTSFTGQGGEGAFGGGGAVAGAANSGSGGSGGSSSGDVGSGGGAGEYVEIIIQNPAASYIYTIGAGGAGGGNGAGAGGSGLILIEEYY